MEKTVKLGFLTAVALILSYVESLIPFSFGVPGMKLGLPNLVVVLLLDYDKAKESVLVNLLRIILAGFLFGNLYAILYAIAGAAFSFTAMMLGRKAGCFSILGVSVLGGVFHNIGQVIVAVLVVETFSVALYMPILMIAGVVTGALIGIAAREITPYLKAHADTIL